MGNPAPVFPARFIASSDILRPSHGSIIAWDPWSEVVQKHGDAEIGDAARKEKRGGHIVPGANSPLSDKGYVLDVQGTASGALDILPDAPMARRGWRFWQRLKSYQPRLAKFVRQAILGTWNPNWHGKVGDAEILIWQSGDQWVLTRPGRPVEQGEGLATLAAALYGIPVGIAGVRIFEAAANVHLDADTALELAALLDRWHDAGARTRRPRP